ncbi:MAG: MBOAT family protein [Flavobacteriales bacterium]|nr:MBOAT family protein [Flavobacteriales bacterium]
MLFNSIDFLIFFCVVALLYFASKPKHRWILLLACSYFFYMYWKWEYIILIIFSTGIDYMVGLKMSELETKKERLPYLLVSLFSNLGLLVIFKYLDLLTFTFNELADTSIPLADLILPMGISFYTFQTLSYSIEIYQGKIKCERHLGKFALYVSFFPQLVAGPIERASSLLPQLKENKNKFQYNNFVNGLTQVIIGFFKKVVVADTIAIYVDTIYITHDSQTGFTLLFATYLFAIQIYCDFSGYTDIAIGCARILGYDLMENFKQPYFSKSITEFWRRWHISLSTWLRDYLYIPLGGNKGGKTSMYRNLIITMLLGGLWHGAAWNYLIWGLLNGVYLAIEKKLKYHSFIEKQSMLIKGLSTVLVFHLICFTWVFFRAETFDKAISIIDKIFTVEYFFNLEIRDTSVFATIVISTALFFLLEVFVFKKLNLRDPNPEQNRVKLIALKVVLSLFILIFGISEGSQFIYFQF